MSGLSASFDVQAKTRYGRARGGDTDRSGYRFITGLGERLVMVSAVKRRQVDSHLCGGLCLILLGKRHCRGERQDAGDDHQRDGSKTRRVHRAQPSR